MTTSKSGHGEKASRKQDLLICALLTEPTVEQAAKKTGIGVTTAFRWLQDPEFQEQYREARRMAVSQAISQLQQASSEAVQTLKAVMADEEAPPASRVSAAKTVLEMSFKAVELEDLAQRIEKLEQSLNKDGGQRAWH
jgi:hypothetical protein